jgi:hypothetical protein
MARRSHQALAAAAAGACLALCACGAGAAPAASGSSPASPAGMAAGGGFCANATNFMKNIPARPTSTKLTAAQARANLATVLTATLKGYSGLEKEAPAKLRKPLRKIIGIYKGDEKILRTTGDMAAVSEAMVQSDGEGARSFEQVLRYLSASCGPGS